VAEFVGIENILTGNVIGREDNLLTVDVHGCPVDAVSERVTGDKNTRY